MKAWLFRHPPNIAVIVDRKIIDGSAWIGYVSHDADDGGWQFHTNEPGPPRIADAAVVGLSEIVDLDDTIRELADLPIGWHAWRDSERSPWQRAETPQLH
ncbi:MAG TPA: hypothetical protein VGF43_03070 [Dongiaceae bacterium]|jgi:hypothetical protein